MFNNRNLIAQITKAIAKSFGKPDTSFKQTKVDTFQGVGPKKSMMEHHRDIKKQKLSRYPKIHQGARECARRRGELKVA